MDSPCVKRPMLVSLEWNCNCMVNLSWPPLCAYFMTAGAKCKVAHSALLPSGVSLQAVQVQGTLSTSASSTTWHRYAHKPSCGFSELALMGCCPSTSPPACIPPELVSPAFAKILQAVDAPSNPPPDLSSLSPLYGAVLGLLSLGSTSYESEVERQAVFQDWHNTCLRAGQLEPFKGQTGNAHDGVFAVGSNGKHFVVSMLTCTTGVGSGKVLVEAMRYGRAATYAGCFQLFSAGMCRVLRCLHARP